jgi:hypothetical protein
MKRFIILLINIAIVSFLFNIVWENAQAPFYANYTGFWQHFQICFWGVLGDVIIILFLYGIFAFVRRDIWWIKSWSVTPIIFLVIVGMITALLIEYYALSVGRWAYDSSMPLFFETKAGLWPVLQMMILPYVTFRLVR